MQLSPDVELMALALKEAQFDEVRVRRLREMIGSGLGADLIRLAATAGATEDRYHVIKSVMTALEALAQKDELMACILMAHLWPRAEEHDVANAIDLWLAHCSSSELNAYLEKLVESELSPSLQRHYRGWLENSNRRLHE